VLFNVAGDASRRGDLADVTYRSGSLQSHFQSQASVSMNARAYHKVYAGDDVVLETSSGRELVAPMSLHLFVAPVSLPAGDYRIVTTIDYRTGSDVLESDITIISPPVTAAAAGIAATQDFPWWIAAVIVIILVSYLIYRRR
jgi:hypothetical protein